MGFRTPDNYRVEEIETTTANWGTIYTVVFRARKDQFLHVHRVTAYSVQDLVQNVLNLYGKTA